MALQDDIFDITDALKGKPEKKLFESLCQRFFETETELEKACDALNDIRRGWRAFQMIINTKEG